MDDQIGKNETVIVTNNCPALRKSEIEYCAMLNIVVNYPTVAVIVNWAQHADSATQYAHWLPLSR